MSSPPWYRRTPPPCLGAPQAWRTWWHPGPPPPCCFCCQATHLRWHAWGHHHRSLSGPLCPLTPPCGSRRGTAPRFKSRMHGQAPYAMSPGAKGTGRNVLSVMFSRRTFADQCAPTLRFRIRCTCFLHPVIIVFPSPLLMMNHYRVYSLTPSLSTHDHSPSLLPNLVASIFVSAPLLQLCPYMLDCRSTSVCPLARPSVTTKWSPLQRRVGGAVETMESPRGSIGQCRCSTGQKASEGDSVPRTAPPPQRHGMPPRWSPGND